MSDYAKGGPVGEGGGFWLDGCTPRYMGRTASRAGRALGSWNDHHAHHDTASAASLRWRLLDRIAGWLYRKGDPR